jgi:hypothetical protein
MKNSSIKRTAQRLLDLTLRDVTGCGKILNQALLSLNRTSRSGFYTFHQRPKAAENVHMDAAATPPMALPPAAIVIQGPLVHQDDFTLESARLYRRLMPGTVVIVSTWNTEPAAALQRFEAEGFTVVASTPPKVSGANNVNFQIVSTRAGISAAKELNCEYVLKSRSDQRFYAQNLLPYFLALLDEYPAAYAEQQTHRIIELSMNVCRYRPYSMCDMFQFGHIKDLEKMWGVELDGRSFSVAEYSRQRITPRKISEDRIAEIYVHRAYLEGLGQDAAVDLARYYEVLANYFIVIDKETVDLFWNKYHAMEYGLAENPLYSQDRAKARFYSRDWHMVRKYGAGVLDTNPALLDISEN